MLKRLAACTLLCAALLAGCAPKVQSPVTEPVSQDAAAPPSKAPAAPAPGSEPLQVRPNLTLKTRRAARLYTGRGPWYLLVAEAAAGQPLEFVESREGWFRVRTAEGENGWVAAADVEIGDGRGAGASYRTQPGAWELTLPTGLTVKVTRVTAGVMKLTVIGLPGPVEVIRFADGHTGFFAALGAGAEGALPVGDGGIGQVSVSERGLLVQVEEPPVDRILLNEGGTLEMEFRPGLHQVERTESGWRVVYQGFTQPVLRREAGGLVLDLPGAAVMSDFVNLHPDEVRLEEVRAESAPAQQPMSSLTATVPTRMPAGGLRLRLPDRGGLYALRRNGRGEVELRFLPPGLKGKTVVIDPGHGGEETGAVGPAGHLEKDVNLAVSLRLQRLLEDAGARVLMTRTEDKRVLTPEQAAGLGTLSERTQADLAVRSAMANEAGADLFLSVHNNGGPAGDGGTETFWAVNNLNAELSRRFAGLVQEETLQALGFYNRGVKQRPFNVIRNAHAPAALAELGFMTAWDEEAVLVSPSGQQAAAEALFRAISRYFEQS